jgi:hypothetical protein
MQTLIIHQTQDASLTHGLPVSTRPMVALGPMAEATLTWAQAQAQPPQQPESFEQWFDSLDEAFAAFDARRAS